MVSCRGIKLQSYVSIIVVLDGLIVASLAVIVFFVYEFLNN